MMQVTAAFWSLQHNLRFTNSSSGKHNTLGKFPSATPVQCGYAHAGSLLLSERQQEAPSTRGLYSSTDCLSSQAKNLTSKSLFTFREAQRHTQNQHGYLVRTSLPLRCKNCSLYSVSNTYSLNSIGLGYSHLSHS